MRVREAPAQAENLEEPVLPALPAPPGYSAGRGGTWGRAWARGPGSAPVRPTLHPALCPFEDPGVQTSCAGSCEPGPASDSEPNAPAEAAQALGTSNLTSSRAW